MRYFKRKPALAITAFRNSLICLAAAILSGIGIAVSGSSLVVGPCSWPASHRLSAHTWQAGIRCQLRSQTASAEFVPRHQTRTLELPRMTDDYFLLFFRARFSIISRISRPSAVLFMTAC